MNMKWIVLLVLFSCGRHQEPAGQDLRDSDGDQVLNYQESPGKQFIADYEPLGLVTGHISFAAGEMTQLSFSNENRKKIDVSQMLASPDNSRDDYFSEWSNLEIEANTIKLPLQKFFMVSFYFDEASVEPTEVILVNGKNRKSLGRWKSFLQLQMSGEDLKSLIAGTSFISLRKSFNQGRFFDQSTEETIRLKTSRVYFQDIGHNKILYVSKELTLPELFSLLKVSDSTEITNHSLFFNGEEQSPEKWFHRQLSGGGIVIAKARIQDIKKKFRDLFLAPKRTLSRVNGYTTSKVHFSVNDGERLFLKVRPRQVVRDFSEKQQIITYRTGSPARGTDDSWKCTHFERSVKTESSLIPAFDLFLDVLNASTAFASLEWREQYDEAGIYWEIALKPQQSEFSLSLAQMPDSTFTVIGEYLVSCERGRVTRGGTPANSEALLSFDIESFVEKIP